MFQVPWRTCGAFVISGLPLLHLGCFGLSRATYPETYDASDFEQFEYRIDDPFCGEMPAASDSPFSRPLACAATITRESTGEYSLAMIVRWDEEPVLAEVPRREMSESEVEQMLSLFTELHINRHPRPFCAINFPYDLNTEYFHRWDEFELVALDCDRPRLSIEESFNIEMFVHSLIGNGAAEPP
ncbi:MAG: hypothetical protein HY763_02435 [Planctomycetes bacterium]|nr:hypothetical protein [Planctomycetota bacterium]